MYRSTSSETLHADASATSRFTSQTASGLDGCGAAGRYCEGDIVATPFWRAAASV